MRAVIFCDYPYRREGESITAEQPVALFLGAVAERFAEATFLGRLDPAAGSFPYPLGEASRFVALPWYSKLSPRSLRGYARALRRYGAALDDADVVWLLGPHPLAVLFAVVGLARRRRVVLGVRQHLPDYLRRRHPGSRLAVVAGRVLEAAWRMLARRCAVVAVGPDLAAGYAHAPELLDSTFSLVEMGRPRADRPWGEAVTVLSVGRLDPEKNPLLLADVLGRLPEAWSLVVCGEGSLRAALEERLAELGVAHRCDLRGHVPAGTALAEVYAASDAFLHVSWTEGFPQVLLEAWAGSLPVVATAVGGVPEVAGDAALLVEAGDPDAAARALGRLAAEPDLRAALVARGGERVAGRTLTAEAARVAAFLAGTHSLRP